MGIQVNVITTEQKKTKKNCQAKRLVQNFMMEQRKIDQSS